MAPKSTKVIPKKNSKASPAPKTPPSKKPTRHAPTEKDMVSVRDEQLLLSIDLKKQSADVISKVELEDGQRFFPYLVMSRLMVGWDAISHISSLELRLSSEHPLPGLVVRFVEKMPKEDVEKMDAALREQILAQIARVRQYPFVTVESPLLDGGMAGAVTSR